ncbi:dysbindin domain-containing protein 2 [Anolis sagrei]|uniref:dysbindin domain-containing protein 2 n=1 Tax=Anolis sagrei TaxID=38937 RepID=UPI0035219EA3
MALEPQVRFRSRLSFSTRDRDIGTSSPPLPPSVCSAFARTLSFPLAEPGAEAGSSFPWLREEPGSWSPPWEEDEKGAGREDPTPLIFPKGKEGSKQAGRHRLGCRLKAMSGPEAHGHSRRLPSDMENGQRGLDAEQLQQQQLKLRERQRFFEEVFQHDVDFFFPVSHLQIEHRRPPLGSISSMEVNVDMLEQMDMMDLSDQDTVDVFLGCGTEDNNNVATLLPDSNHYQEEISLQVPNTGEVKSRISSTSSASTDLNSLDTSEEGAETPVVQSDEEDLQHDGPEEQETKS